MNKKNSKVAAAIAAVTFGVGALVLSAPLAASATPYNCSTSVGGRDLGWYGDAICANGSGQYRAVADCNGAGGRVFGLWVTSGHRSSAWCGWWGVSSVWVQER